MAGEYDELDIHGPNGTLFKGQKDVLQTLDSIKKDRANGTLDSNYHPDVIADAEELKRYIPGTVIQQFENDKAQNRISIFANIP